MGHDIHRIGIRVIQMERDNKWNGGEGIDTSVVVHVVKAVATAWAGEESGSGRCSLVEYCLEFDMSVALVGVWN